MFKTFSDFARLASRVYHLPQEIAENMIESKLKEQGLSPLAVVAYSNWADGDCLSQEKIAEKLGVNQSTIARHLQKLEAVWPHLFNFGPKPPRTVHNHRGKKSTSLDTLDETEIKRMF